MKSNDNSESEPSRRSGRLLKRCKACGHEISRKARACPHCGHAKKRKLRAIVLVLAILFVIFHDPIHDALGIPDPVDFILHNLLGMPEPEEAAEPANVTEGITRRVQGGGKGSG